MNPSPAARLKRARINLLMDEPFFGSLMMQLTTVESSEVPRFRTDGSKLWYNTAYMATLDDGQLRTVLAHEVLHPALLHPFRLGDRDLKLANVAADYAINNFLDAYNRESEAKGDPAPFPWPKRQGGEPDVLLDHTYDGMSFEEIYAALMRKPRGGGGQQNPPAQQQNAPFRRQNAPGSKQNAPSQGPDLNGQGEGKGEEPSSPGEFVAAAKDPAEAQAQEAKWKVALKQASLTAKAQGRMPGELARSITEILDPKASWKEILRTLLTSAAKDDYTFSRPNPRYLGRGLILPSMYVPRMGTVAVAVDTSGSIRQQELNEFLAEVRSILFDCRPEKMLLMECDAEVRQCLELDPCDEVGLEVKGGGGTDFRPIFDGLAEQPEPPAALVYLTDLMGSFPNEAPIYPVIWASNNERNGPFGDTVHI